MLINKMTKISNRGDTLTTTAEARVRPLARESVSKQQQLQLAVIISSIHIQTTEYNEQNKTLFNILKNMGNLFFIVLCLFLCVCMLLPTSPFFTLNVFSYSAVQCTFKAHMHENISIHSLIHFIHCNVSYFILSVFDVVFWLYWTHSNSNSIIGIPVIMKNKNSIEIKKKF